MESKNQLSATQFVVLCAKVEREKLRGKCVFACCFFSFDLVATNTGHTMVKTMREMHISRAFVCHRNVLS
jgi:hypothetical protein